MIRYLLLIITTLLTFSSYLEAATITWSKDFADGQTLSGSDFDNLQTDITTVVNAGGGPVTLTASQTLSGDNTYSGASTFSGAITANANVTIGNAVTDNLTLTSAIQGASPLILDGATDDTATVTIAIYDEGTSVTYGISDMAENGSFIMSTLDNTLGDLDDANAIWGESNNLVLEGATANAFETRITTDDIGADQDINISQQAIRGWIQYDQAGGTATIADGFNATVTDGAAGVGTVNWGTDFANANYAVVCISNQQEIRVGALAGGTVVVTTFNSSGSATDADEVCCIAAGDQT